MRAGLVEDMKELGKYPWTGHSALMGIIQRKWQDTDIVLAYFGSRLKQARDRYQEFVEAGIAQGRRKDLVGGGLVRSAGGCRYFRFEERVYGLPQTSGFSEAENSCNVYYRR